MGIDVIVPTYSGHYEFVKKFFDTFSLNCDDKDDVTISLIVSSSEREMFERLIVEYGSIHIKVMIFRELVKKYDNVDMSEDELLSSIGKFSYQSLKKLYGSLETNNNVVCIFDSECLFVRKFKMADYIEHNISKYVYCSRMTVDPSSDGTHARYMQNLMNEMMGANDRNWYLESYAWVFRRDILLELKTFLESR